MPDSNPPDDAEPAVADPDAGEADGRTANAGSGNAGPADPDALAEKHEQNREERLDAVLRWVEYIEEHPPEVWGPQQNRLVNSQLESARESGLSVEHRRRVEAFGEVADEFGDSTDG